MKVKDVCIDKPIGEGSQKGK